MAAALLPAWGLAAWTILAFGALELVPQRSSREERPDGGGIRPAHLDVRGAAFERPLPGGRRAEIRAERIWTDSRKVAGFKVGPLLQYRYSGFALDLRDGEGTTLSTVSAAGAVMARPGEPIELSEPRVVTASGRTLLARDAVLDIETGRIAGDGSWALWEAAGSPAVTGRGFEATLDMEDFRDRRSRR